MVVLKDNEESFVANDLSKGFGSRSNFDRGYWLVSIPFELDSTALSIHTSPDMIYHILLEIRSAL